MILWGGTWTSAKLVSVNAPVELLIFWRFLPTALSMIPFLLFFKTGIRVKAQELLLLAIGGGVIFIYNIGFFSGVRVGLAGAGGVLVTGLNPVLTFLLTVILTKEKASLRQILALIIGFGGGLIMLEIWTFSPEQIFNSGNSWFLFASFTWAVLTMLSHRIQRTVHFLVYGFYIYLFCSLYALILALSKGSLSQTPVDLPFWLNMAYISIAATSLATTVYFLCTRELGSRIASSFIFTVPVSALVFSWMILGEVPAVHTVLGGALTIAAVYVINSSPGKGKSQ